jgi:hypothetical protein
MLLEAVGGALVTTAAETGASCFTWRDTCHPSKSPQHHGSVAIRDAQHGERHVTQLNLLDIMVQQQSEMRKQDSSTLRTFSFMASSLPLSGAAVSRVGEVESCTTTATLSAIRLPKLANTRLHERTSLRLLSKPQGHHGKQWQALAH